MKSRAAVLIVLTCLVVGTIGTVRAAYAQDDQYVDWNAEQNRIDKTLLDLQHKRFQASRLNDEEKLSQLQKEIDEVQKERVEILKNRGISLSPSGE